MAHIVKRNNGDGTRRCSKCGKNQLVSIFSPNKRALEGLASNCNLCIKAYRVANIHHIKEKAHKRYLANKEDRAFRNKNYRENNKETLKEWGEKFRRENKERLSLEAKQRHQKNKELIKRKRRQTYQKKKENGLLTLKPGELSKWMKRGEVNRKRKKERYAVDIQNPLFKLKHRLRARITTAFTNKGWSKKSSLYSIVGDFDIAKKYIERQFSLGMSWGNYGDWHLDHIIPLSSAQFESDLIILCHFTNLQPLWAHDNLSKGAKIPQVQLKMAV